MEEDASSPREPAFDRLPPKVIEHILYVADANTFASLSLLNRLWRRTSESPALYAHHLSRCPSFAWARGTSPAPGETGESESLPVLKDHFIEEIRRNAFDVFLRPRRTLVRLISSSMSSSTAFPQGEVFRFSFSANGQLVLCISSSRIVVLELSSDPVAVKHELKTRRRPLGATIHDDGSLLAVLSSTHKVNIYRLCNEEVRLMQTITLNDAPRDLKFSPTGSVLALSFEDCIEVHAVGEEVLVTERRAARCPRIDTICFSPDGSMLLGSPVDYELDGIVTITAPFYTEPGLDVTPQEVQMRMWTTQILFPEITSGFTHACLIKGHEEEDDSWILGYDIQLAAFRAIKINNTGTGGVYFASPFLADEPREMLPIMLPTTDEFGELVALGFQDSEVWIYGVPKRLDVPSTSPTSGPQEDIETHFNGDYHCQGQAPPRDNLVQLHKIIQQPKTLIRGRRVADMHGMTAAHWVRSTPATKFRRRLVTVAPGGVRPQIFGEEDVPVDGGRMLVLDFERSTNNGGDVEIDIEIGETEPKMLMEPDSSLDTEVELERRRTRLNRGDTDPTTLTALGRRSSRSTRQNPRSASQTLLPHIRRNSLSVPTSPEEVTAGNVPEIPYDNTQPRSQDTLHRAATAAASTRGRYDPRYRNTPSRRYVPHESDADNWVPPPPPYKREADEPLPEHLRQTLLPSGASNNLRPGESATQQIQRAQTTRVARPYPQGHPRPQSAILQRLGSISRRPIRARGDSASPIERPVQDHIDVPTLAVPQPPEQIVVTESSPVNAWPRPRTTAPPTVPVVTGQLPSLQPLPQLTVQSSEQATREPIMTMPSLGATMLGEAYLPYSVSSPNLLHIPEPHGNALDISAAEDEAQVPERQRSFRRRVSTEPISLPPPENEEWRRRIEDWNEHTIRERSRKRRNKCIIM
ncbi:hypothetical protein N7532_003874 [Penicillium argentinense]|uniref:DUF7165 domain-containing protein n=1 Tax=Penicillium argentinense TaxID=1131581 RepID=A0A9W9FNA5_9EURO|nr:uncharacterized protein N7532_003874 [Penicillium argentinense]KAJ5103345.1 hypothetical protein N7532_003874 [Penicillium argentinense]